MIFVGTKAVDNFLISGAPCVPVQIARLYGTFLSIEIRAFFSSRVVNCRSVCNWWTVLNIIITFLRD